MVNTNYGTSDFEFEFSFWGSSLVSRVITSKRANTRLVNSSRKTESASEQSRRAAHTPAG